MCFIACAKKTKMEMVHILLARFNVTVRTLQAGNGMQDSFYINGSYPPVGNKIMMRAVQRTVRAKSALFAVMDSVGAAADGVPPAYKMAELLHGRHDKFVNAKLEQLDMLLEDFLTDANGEMSSTASAASISEYGSSYAMLHINNGVATVSGAGNVRGFLYRAGSLMPMTDPGAGERQAVAAGAAHSEQEDIPAVRMQPQSYIGSANSGDLIDYYASDSVPVERDDLYLLCSDGLTNILPDSRIRYILSLGYDDERTVQRIISEAAARGAQDDATVMLVRNGGKPVRSHKASGTFLKAAIAVAVLAVFVAFLSASLKSCSKKPAIQEDDGFVPAPAPTATDFVNTEEPAVTLPPDDFVLRSSVDGQ